MENYENKELYTEPTAPQPEEPVSQESAPASASREPEAAPVFHEPVSQPYSGAGVGRKESPFADSPYVVNHQPESRTYRQPDPNAYRCGSTYVPPIPPQQPPVKPKKQKKAGNSKVWKKVSYTELWVVFVFTNIYFNCFAVCLNNNTVKG